MKRREDDSDDLGYRQKIDDAICYVVGSTIIVVSSLPLTLYFTTRRYLKPRKQSRRNPPEAPEFLMWFFVPREVRDPLLGDLAEEFIIQKRHFGYPAATAWYWAQAIRVVGKSPAMAVIARLVRYGSLVGILTALRRLI